MKDLLELELIEINSFMGIDSSKPAVFDFTKRRKNQNITEIIGDMKLGKSSRVLGILYAMGGHFGIDKKILFNSTDGTININHNFKYNGVKHLITCSGERVTLKKYYEDDEKWVPQNEPLATIQEIFGPVGLFPFSLREMDGKKQIQFFRDMFGGGEEASKKEKTLEKNLKTVFDQRRDVNRDIKNLKGALEVEPLYQNYEKSQARFKAAPNAKKEKEELDSLTGKKQEHDKAKSAVEQLKQSRAHHERNIADLEERLKKEKDGLAATEKRLADGKKYLGESNGIDEKYEAANEAWLNLSKTLAEYERWKAVLKKEKEMHEMEDTTIKATGQIDKIRLDLLELTKTYLPKVKGLSIKVNTGLDDDDKEGVLYQDDYLARLSESEYTDLWCQICEAKEIDFIFLENTANLGSGVVDTLNQMAKNGVQIFAAKMDREVKKEVEVAFVAKLD